MDLNRLKYFCNLCETKNMTKAAERSFISRQAVQQAVRALEDELHVTLIEKSKNRISVTPAGSALYGHAIAILSEEKLLRRDMRTFLSSDETLRIGISQSIIPLYAPEILEKILSFPAAHPNLKTDICAYSSETVVDMLKSGKLDVGFVIDMEAVFPELKRTVLRTDPLAADCFIENTPSEFPLSEFRNHPVSCMGTPEIFLKTLYDELSRRKISVNWQNVPAFFDAVYQASHNGWVCLDRYEPDGKISGMNYRCYPVEGDFNLHLSMLTPDPPLAIVEILRDWIMESD